MFMSRFWGTCMIVSACFAFFGGTGAQATAALLSGASSAVELCVAMAGALARLLRPLLRRIFPKSFADEDCAAAISQNFTANLLGLGNAATPAGLKAAARMHALSPEKNLASGEMCRLVVLNSASVQLIPTTVAALRSAAGAADAFDILPCVWLTSIVSVAVGLTSARLMEAWGK